MDELSPQDRQAVIEELTRAIEQEVEDEVGQMARTLAETPDHLLLGDNEFALRDLAHKVAAKALQARLREKKLPTGAARSTAPAAGVPHPSTGTGRAPS